MIYKIILIIIAAICKAIADTISPRKSELSKKGDFWNIHKQGKFLPLTKYPLDGWHIFNSIMIICFVIMGIFETKYEWYITIPLLGFIFILVFNFTYNKILK